MTRCALLLLVISLYVIGCGDSGPPALTFPDGGGMGGSGGESGTGGSGGTSGDSGVDAGGTGGELTGDLCESYLTGISCRVKQIAAGRSFSCALFDDGRVKCWGRWGGTIGDGPDEMGEALGFVDFGVPVEEIAAGVDELAARTSDGRVFSAYGDLAGVEVSAVTIPADNPAVALGGPSCALLSDGAVSCWTWGRYSVLDSYSLDRTVIVPINSTLSSPARITQATVALATQWVVDGMSNIFNTCVVTDTGEAQCWGNGAAGNLGPGDTYEPSASLPPLPFGEPVKQVVPGSEHTCAIMEEQDALRCFGKGNLGQLGQNSTANRGKSPGELEDLRRVQIGPVAEVVVGGVFTCARTIAGPTVCWGGSNYGQTGRGDALNFGSQLDDFPNGAIAVALGTGRRALQLAAGESHACALLDDHSVKCWGQGASGALGYGDVANRGDGPNEMGDSLPRVPLGERTLEEIRELAPQVEVLAPTSSIDPTVDDIHVGNTLSVRCSVSPSAITARGIDESSVTIRVRLGGSDGLVIAEVPAAAGSEGTYTGTVVGFRNFASGAYWIECTAADVDDMPLVGFAGVPILHDSGPALSVVSPALDAVVGQAAVMRVEVSVLPAPLGADDDEADLVGAPQLIVAGVPVALTPAATAGRYTADIDFLAPAFQPAPVGPVSITLSATNERGETATLQHGVVVDGTGPAVLVTGTNHADGSIIRGAQAMLLTVTDTPAGVNPNGVYGRIGNTTFPFVNTTGNTYRGVFDTLVFDRTVSQLTVEIHAFDQVGNETIEPRTFQLDNQSPIASLDSAMVREYRTAGTVTNCSVPFDPLGVDSVKDGATVPEGAEFRARVEDRTNGVSGVGIVSIYAGVDPEGVDLYVLSGAGLSRPLLIDTDGDGACDEINDELSSISGTSQFQTLSLRAITPKGTSLFTDVAGSFVNVAPLWNAGPSCEGLMNPTTMAPPLVCAPASNSSELTRVIKAPLSGTLPAIWGLRGGTDILACAGHYWDWQISNPTGGPACVAVRAADNVGNVGVSVPLRVCFQRSTGGAFDCGADLSWQTRNCTTGTYRGVTTSCTLPPDFPPMFRRAD